MATIDQKSGVFAGLVSDNIPPAGKLVSGKPKNFVAMQFGDADILTETLTTTLYPLEAVEGIEFSFDIESASMNTIPDNDMDVGAGEFLGGQKIPVLLTGPTEENAMDVAAGELLAATKFVALLTGPTEENAVDVSAGEFLGGTKELKLVTGYSPGEGIELAFDLDVANCSMTPV